MTASLKRHGLWLLVSILGAFALATVALGRGETISALWVVVAAVCTYLIAYRYYALFIATRVLQPGVEDVVFCYLRFPSGKIAHMHLSWLDPHKMRKITLTMRLHTQTLHCRNGLSTLKYAAVFSTLIRCCLAPNVICSPPSSNESWRASWPVCSAPSPATSTSAVRPASLNRVRSAPRTLRIVGEEEFERQIRPWLAAIASDRRPE